MTYKYKITRTRRVISGLTVILDLFLLPLITMLAWNNILVDIVKVTNVTYIQLFCLRYDKYRYDKYKICTINEFNE